MKQLVPVSLVLICLAACKQPAPSTKHRDAVRAEAHHAWMDLQLCLGGEAPLPGGDAFVEHLDRVTRSRLVPDDWPLRCVPFRDRLEALLRAGDLPAVAEVASSLAIAKSPTWNGSTWDAIVAALSAEDLPSYGWDAKSRPVVRPVAPRAPALKLADLKVQPGTPAREAAGPAPYIPGARPPGLDVWLAATDEPTCVSATTHAVIADGHVAIGTTQDGWAVFPFAQPFDHSKPLVCGDGTAELVHAQDGVWRIACSRAGCTYEHAALGERSALVQDAVLSGGQIHAALRGAGGRVFLVRGADMAALASAPVVAVVDAPDAKVRLQPLDGGLAILLELDGKLRAVQVTRDGKMFDL